MIFPLLSALLSMTLVGGEPRQTVSVGADGPFLGNGTLAARKGWAIAGLGVLAGTRDVTAPEAVRPVAVAYRRDAGEWTLRQVLSARARDNVGARFVACDGRTAVVGIWTAVLIYELSDGAWRLAGELGKTDGFHPRMVKAACVDGEVIVLGLPNEPRLLGSALVLERRSGTWERAALLGGDDAWFRFGWSVAVERGTIAVGVPGHPEAVHEPGSVHLFGRDADGWKRTQILRGPGSTPTSSGETWQDDFGDSLALRGDLLAVGAIDDALLYRRGDRAWEPAGSLRAADEPAEGPTLEHDFGPWAVATDGRRVAVHVTPLGVRHGGGWRIRIFGRARPGAPWTPGRLHEDFGSSNREAFALCGSDLLVPTVGGRVDGELRGSTLVVFDTE